jgi:hypothetical protein
MEFIQFLYEYMKHGKFVMFFFNSFSLFDNVVGNNIFGLKKLLDLKIFQKT